MRTALPALPAFSYIDRTCFNSLTHTYITFMHTLLICTSLYRPGIVHVLHLLHCTHLPGKDSEPIGSAGDGDAALSSIIAGRRGSHRDAGAWGN